MLASHPGIVYDADEQAIAVAPAVQAQMGDLLAYISADFEANALPGQRYSLPAATPSRETIVWGNGGDVNGVLVTAIAEPGQTDLLVTAVTTLGGSRVVAYDDHVSAVLPFAAIDDMAAIPSLQFADVVYESQPNAASASSTLDSEGVIALLADAARSRFGVDGTGLRIGIISDSFNTLGGYAYDVSSGVLPAGVEVLKEGWTYSQDGEAVAATDEGRAMAQLIYAIAPGAELYFAASGTSTGFADSIERLTAAGCQIIVDDITETNVPWFQDGIVAKAVNAAVQDAGVAYFAAAGNFARNSYQSEFRGVAGDTLADLPQELREIPGVVLHDFDPGPGVDVFQQIVIPSGTTEIQFQVQWDQPWGANASDLDLFIYDADGTTLLARLEGNHQLSANPMIAGLTPNDGDAHINQLLLVSSQGVVPGIVKYVTFHTDLQPEYATQSSTIVGHANSATGAAVGASVYFETPAYGQENPELVYYSSWGGTPILFDVDGNRLANSEVRQQPMFVAPTFSNNTFLASDVNLDGIPNFSGTSAAAPQAAAVAALMWQLVPDLSADEIFRTLATTTVDMLAPGFDFASGLGLIQGEQAIARAADISISGTVFEDFDRNGLQTPDELPIADATVFLDLNGNGRLDAAPAAGAASPYASFASTEPVHVGIRSVIPNPNTPSDGPLQQPYTARSSVEVADLPGVVTDVGVLMTLQSDHVIDNELVGPLFVDLISPEGIRVPLRGTHVTGTGNTGDPFFPHPLMLDATGQPTSLLVSLTPTPVSDFTSGTGMSQLPQVDLAAMLGSSPNGTWHLEVQSADFDPQRTLSLTAWTLFLKSAEPSAQTGASGGYTFAGLPPSAVAGAFAPRLVVPTSRELTTNEDFAFNLEVRQAVEGVDFGVTIPQPVPRPALLPVSVLRVSSGVIGPQPVVFSWSDLSAAALTQPTGDRFVVVDAVHGRVEKWDGEAWADVTRPPVDASPQAMLADLARRVIRPNDTIRWVPPADGGESQVAFTVLGWNGLDTSDGTSDVSFESTPA